MELFFNLLDSIIGALIGVSGTLGGIKLKNYLDEKRSKKQNSLKQDRSICKKILTVVDETDLKNLSSAAIECVVPRAYFEPIFAFSDTISPFEKYSFNDQELEESYTLFKESLEMFLSFSGSHLFPIGEDRFTLRSCAGEKIGSKEFKEKTEKYYLLLDTMATNFATFIKAAKKKGVLLIS